jgi:signal transduction histidine kinase
MQEANEQLVLAALSAQELAAAAEQAQQRQSEFLAVLTHELRDPLTPIRTAAAILGHAGSSESVLSSAKAVIDRQVAHMFRLLDDLLDVSRGNTRKLDWNAGYSISARLSKRPSIHAVPQSTNEARSSGSTRLTS